MHLTVSFGFTDIPQLSNPKLQCFVLLRCMSRLFHMLILELCNKSLSQYTGCVPMLNLIENIVANTNNYSKARSP